MTAYYTYASITQRSFSSIWRRCWQLYGLAGPLVFVHFAVRKLLRLRRTVYWGFPRPEHIDPLPATALPFVVRKEFEPAERACQAAGMRHIYYTRAPHIGGAQRYAAAYLSVDGTFYTGIVWNHFVFKGQTRASTVFACHTPLTGGRRLHTSAVPRKYLDTDVISPDHEMLRLPPDIPPEEVIARHIERVHQASGVVRLREDNLIRFVLDDVQQLFDWMVEKGLYVPLTEQEVARLTSEAADVDLY
jgi:hypothetical protein